MIAVAETVLIIFGLFTMLGGLIGFLKAKSKASLIAGGISGALLMAAGALIYSGRVQAGLILGLVVSLLLLGRFLPAFLKTRKVMPAGITAALGIAATVVCILALVRP